MSRWYVSGHVWNPDPDYDAMAQTMLDLLLLSETDDRFAGLLALLHEAPTRQKIGDESGADAANDGGESEAA